MTKKQKISVLLFEDKRDERETILKALKTTLPKGVEVIPFIGTAVPLNGTYETRLLNAFKNEFKQASLILCDQDLSQIEGYSGLSANVVTAIAREEGIPIAIYGRGNNDDMLQRLRQRRHFLERRFILELGDEWIPESFAKSAAMVLRGCMEIREFLKEATKKGKAGGGSPAVWLSRILGKDSIRTRLSLYGSGDQQYLETLVFTDVSADSNKAIRILSSELSYWLWDSILRFPGILVDETAAASLLNLSPSSWEKEGVRKLFSSALYTGPFSTRKQHWWRDEIVAILSKNECADGLELAKMKKISGVAPSKCSVDPSKKAGYYCMLSRQPVSIENSVGSIPYFPSGADLARISSKEFARIAPWAGLEVKK